MKFLESKTLPVQALALLCSGHFYSHFAMLCIAPMFLLMSADMKVSFTELGALISVMAFSTGVGQIPMGYLVDRIGGCRVLIFGVGLMSVCFLISGMIGTYWLIFFAFGLAGIGNSVFHPADYEMLNSLLNKSVFAHGVSLHMFSGYMGWAAAYAVMLPMANFIGWQNALAVVGVLGLLLTLFLISRKNVLEVKSSLELSLGNQLKSKVELKKALRFIFSAPLVNMFLFFSLTAIGIAGLMSFSVVALVSYHAIDEYFASLSTTLHLVSCALGVLIGGWIANCIKHQEFITAVSIATMSACVAGLAFSGVDFWFIFLMMIAGGLAYGISSPSRDVLVKKVSPKEMTGLAFGFTSTGFSIGNLVGPIFAGWIMDSGRPEFFFLAIALIIAISIITLIKARI